MNSRGNAKPARNSWAPASSSLCGFGALCLLLLAAAPAHAHPVPFSYLDLRLERAALDGTLVVHIYDAAHDLNVEPMEKLLDPAVAAQQAGALATMLGARFTVTADGRPLTAAWAPGVEVLAERQSLKLSLRFPLTAPAGRLGLTAVMFPYDPQHQTFLNVYDGEALTQAILDSGHNQFEYFAGTAQGAIAVVRRFLPAGITHIVVGPDHLLFLLGLLLLGGTMRHLALIVSAFTAAHSLTMSLAAMNLMSPPARIIEPAIALSIVYVGADNLLIRGGRDVRAWIAFAFGFIHGFGFAGVLREMSLPRRALGWSLVSINFGIEIGQLAVVVVVASALAALRARSEQAGRQLAFAGSVAVIAAGAFWFIQRVFFPGGIS